MILMLFMSLLDKPLVVACNILVKQEEKLKKDLGNTFTKHMAIENVKEADSYAVIGETEDFSDIATCTPAKLRFVL